MMPDDSFGEWRCTDCGSRDSTVREYLLVPEHTVDDTAARIRLCDTCHTRLLPDGETQ